MVKKIRPQMYPHGLPLFLVSVLIRYLLAERSLLPVVDPSCSIQILTHHEYHQIRLALIGDFRLIVLSEDQVEPEQQDVSDTR